MIKISIKKLNNLLLKKYQAEIISKQQFKDAIYGPNRIDLDNDTYTLTEGIIDSENVVFYLINKVKIINKYCNCIDSTYPIDKTLPFPSSGFMPYIVFVAELSDDKQQMINYAKWGSFGDNLFEELHELELETENEPTK